MPARRRFRRAMRVLLRVVAFVFALGMIGGVALWFSAREAMGGAPTVADVARAEQSPQWRDGRFQNRLRRIDGSYVRMTAAFLFGGSKYRVPAAAIPVVPRVRADYEIPPASGLRTTWLGHSTLLLEIDGQRVLIDPVWGERASPFSFMGPKRFYAPPLPLAQLPDIDAVIISHDHYDHLDMPTVKALLARHVRWIVPLGVAVHLRAWGIRDSLVTELDWWDATSVGELTITATPARHFSGRGLNDARRTLWAGWAFAGATHRVFYSGDTSLHDQFAEIGRRLGPFDLTMIEAGAYDALWVDVHLGPEQAVLAHQLVGGDVMVPVHWGLFDLALHGWTEPIERVLAAAREAGVRVVAPRPGDMIEPSRIGAPERWWPETPWRTARDAPAFSTGVAHLLGQRAQSPR